VDRTFVVRVNKSKDFRDTKSEKGFGDFYSKSNLSPLPIRGVAMGRDGGKGGRGRGRRSDDKSGGGGGGGNGRVKMVDREIEALEAAIEVRRDANLAPAADLHRRHLCPRHVSLPSAPVRFPPGTSAPGVYLSRHDTHTCLPTHLLHSPTVKPRPRNPSPASTRCPSRHERTASAATVHPFP